MKRLVYIIVFALGLTACYDDKGAHDYHDICAVSHTPLTLPTSEEVEFLVGVNFL